MVVFANPLDLSISQASEYIQQKLIAGFFVPSEWQLPRLNLYPYDSEIDHDYLEVDDIRRFCT